MSIMSSVSVCRGTVFTILPIGAYHGSLARPLSWRRIRVSQSFLRSLFVGDPRGTQDFRNRSTPPQLSLSSLFSSVHSQHPTCSVLQSPFVSQYLIFDPSFPSVVQSSSPLVVTSTPITPLRCLHPLRSCDTERTPKPLNSQTTLPRFLGDSSTPSGLHTKP